MMANMTHVVHIDYIKMLIFLCNVIFYDEDGDYEGVFLQKVPRRVEQEEEMIFVVNVQSEYSFRPKDILAI